MPSESGKSLTVLVPALNEEKSVGSTVESVLRALSTTIKNHEIIVVNDGSTDGTRQVIDELARIHPNVRAYHNDRRMGLGFAYLLGVERASKDHYVYIPGDNTWPFDSLVMLFEKLGKAEIITSFATNPQIRPFGRRILSKGYTGALNLLFGKKMKYYNGLTIYPVGFLRRSPISTFSFGFQAEALLKAIFSGLSVLEVGLQIDARAAGGSKAVRLGNIARVATTVVRLFLNLRAKPKQIG